MPSLRNELPSWEPAVAAELMRAQRNVHLIGRTTPSNLTEELVRLEGCFRKNTEPTLRFTYESAPPGPLERELSELGDKLDSIAEPLALTYAARARELALEQSLCTSVGQLGFWSKARRRFTTHELPDPRADALADAWLSSQELQEDGAHPASGSLSDDEQNPESLVQRMRSAVGARRLPFRVLVSDRLSALAATGNGVIWVASGRRLLPEAVARTVLHEVDGHALPRSLADGLALGLFRLGSAGGSDDQEGRALVLEDRAGFLQNERRLELARRHLACRRVEAGEPFGSTVDALTHVGTPLATALRIAARAHRGGGLGREAVYLRSYLRVSDALNAQPSLDEVLGKGRISVTAAPLVAPWLHLPSHS